MGSRSYNRPSNVIALFFIVVALVDAFTGLVNLQIPDAAKGLAAGAAVQCPTLNPLAGLVACTGVANNGWYADLLTAAIATALATLLLLRPERLVYAGAAAWSAVALFANIVVRTDDKAIDYLVTFRATIYLITLVIAAILVAFEWQTYMAANAAQKAEAAKAAAAAAKAAPAAPARARRTTKP